MYIIPDEVQFGGKIKGATNGCMFLSDTIRCTGILVVLMGEVLTEFSLRLDILTLYGKTFLAFLIVGLIAFFGAL